MKKMLVGVLMVLGLMAGAVAQPALAKSELDDDICQDPGLSDELKEVAGCNTTKRADTVVNDVIKIVTGVVGFLAVCVMIYGGFIFLRSAGDASKVAQGKNILLYGVVGLVIALLAFAIVSFVGGAIGR